MSERCEECEHPLKASEVLDKAAQVVETDGWFQGEYYRPVRYEGEDPEEYDAKDTAARRGAPCCQAGAISRAATGYAWVSRRDFREFPEGAFEVKKKADDYMDRYVRDVLNYPMLRGSAVSWNDEPERTAEEVAAALRGAAQMARAAGD